MEGRWGSTVRLCKKLRVSAGARQALLIRASTITDIDDINDWEPNTPPAMSALPRSIRSRVLAPALRPAAARALAPRYRAYATKPETTPEDAPAVKLTSESTQIREESASEGMRHQPDYNVAIDYRTSCVSAACFAGKPS
jgi:hypothetical protein